MTTQVVTASFMLNTGEVVDMNTTTTDVTTFWSNQIITQIKKIIVMSSFQNFAYK